MQAFMFIAGALVLGIAGHLIRRPPCAKKLSAVLAFTIGLSGAAFGVRALVDHKGMERATDYDGVVSAALDDVKQSSAPYVLFVGSSHSRNGIDDVYLTQELAKRGYKQRAVNMSMYGASYQERGIQIDRFITAAVRKPDVVFLEVSQMYDEAPAYAFQVAKFSDRAIAQMNPGSVRWAVQGLAEDYRHGIADRMKDVSLLGIHAVLNVLNVGLLHTAEGVGIAAPQGAFLGEDRPKEILNPQVRAANLTRSVAATADQTAWAAGFRERQEEKLRGAGVRRVGYYLPPVTDPEARAFVQRFCDEQAGKHACVAPTDPKLLADLNGDLWFDHEHLLRKGAHIYDSWLAAQLDASGALK
jgi:hypothetical protein